MNIVYNQRIDRENIADATVMEVAVAYNYSTAIVANETVDLKTLGSTDLEKFCKVIDYATFLVEENAFIWKIKRSAKVFDLTDSYVRDAESTATPLTAIPNAKPLKVLFEIAGFASNRTLEMSLWKGNSFLTGELNDLRDAGIIVTGNGNSFEVENTIETRISFVKPSGVTDVYVIDKRYDNDIITI